MFVCISDEQMEMFLAHFNRKCNSKYYMSRPEMDFWVVTSFETVYGQVDVWLN